MKTRIVERNYPSGLVKFVIQQKHFLFRWWWVDGHVNSTDFASCQDEFDSFDQAAANLWRFDGSVPKDVVVPFLIPKQEKSK